MRRAKQCKSHGVQGQIRLLDQVTDIGAGVMACPPQIFDLGWTDPAARLSPSCGMIAA